jgi:hypothetical protein
MPLDETRSSFAFAPAAVSLCSLSGRMIFAISRAAGALITLAVRRCPAISMRPAEFPNPTYAASTPPAIVAMPPTISAITSLRVMRAR